MSGPLQGFRVLVTRPPGQGENLCRLIETSGGEPVLFPVLEIAPAKDLDHKKILELFSGSSHIVFISRNAVIFSSRLTDDFARLLEGKKIFATGAGTMEELNRLKVNEVITPTLHTGSEALLELEEMNERSIRGKNVLIVRGDKGRELLMKELLRRGARAGYAGVYRRAKPGTGPEIVNSIWQDTRPDVIVVTSRQGLQNLIEMTGEKYREALLGTRLVVISTRIRDAAKMSGFIVSSIVAPDPSDQGLLQALRHSVELKR